MDPAAAVSPARQRARPLPLRPRGGFGGYLHELRRERGLTVRQLAAAAGVHHTYVSKLERGDRQAPDEPVVEGLARAVEATPAQLDQLRWRAGLSPRGSGAPGQDDPTLTLVAEALGDGSLSPAARDRLRQAVARAVQGPGAAGPGVQGPGSAGSAPWATGPGGFAPGAPGDLGLRTSDFGRAG
jgi:transcriptional regulator with XRE-family HTH domain